MIRKDELRKLRTLNATPAMIRAAKDNDIEYTKTVKNSWGINQEREFKRKYGYFLRCQNLGVYLKIAVFFSVELNKGNHAPYYEIFINTETGEYITRRLIDGKEKFWLSAMIENLEVPYGNEWEFKYYSENLTWINPEGKSTLKRVFETQSGDVYSINEYQKKMRKMRRDKQYDLNIAKWEKKCEVPELTPQQIRWMEHEATRENVIFYKYQREGVKEGYCTYCEAAVPIPEKYKNNLKSSCPVCKKKITLKSIGNRKRWESKEYRATIMQQNKAGNIIIRIFTVWKCSYYPFNDVQYHITEWTRFVYTGKEVKRYDHNLYKNYKMCWNPYIQSYYGSPLWAGNGMVYMKNLRSLEKGLLKFSGLPTMLRKNKLKETNVQQWLHCETGNPVLEQLVKMEMYTLAQELADCRYDNKLLNESATGAADILKLDKARLKRLRAFGKRTGLYHVRWLQHEKQLNTQWPDELISFFVDNELNYTDFDFLEVKMGYREIKNYLEKQSAMTKDSIKQTVRTWRDYIQMAKKLGKQMQVEQVYKPSNLQQKHTEMVELSKTDNMKLQAKKLEKEWPKVNEVLEGLQKYQYTDGTYTICTPQSVYDIVREGTLLSHCIHTVDYYWNRISTRETYIFFLRKASCPKTPWYTLEVEPDGSIRQKRTTGDNQNADLKKAEPFLKEWQKELKKVLTEEDKRLAKKSKELRKKGYKELREKNERIRRGKLAGQLLADVLEADYMEAI